MFAADLYKQLFGNASNAAATAAGNAGDLRAVAGDLFTGGSSFLESLGGDAGTRHLTDRITGENPLLDQQIEQLQQDTGRFFNEELNPAITSRAVAGGNYGGGRQGVAQGLAAERAAGEFTRGATALRVADMTARDTAAATVAQNSLSAATTGLGALPGLMELITAGNNAEMGIYANLGTILGGPTVLSDSRSNSFGTSTQQSAAEAFSNSFGQQSSSSQATNSSASKASGWNFNMSGYGGVGASGGG